MKALVFDGKLALKEIPKPEPGPDEALVKVIMAGICKTDVEIVRGYMAFHGVLGHEFVGVVEQSPVPEMNGRRVVGEINAGCGECSFCAGGLERHCPHRTVLGILGRDGALSEYLVLPVANLLPVPARLSHEQAVFTEPLAAAVEILEQVKILPANRGLIVGDGKLGQLIGMVLRLTGSHITMVGKHPEKLERFSELGGSVVLLDELSARDDRFDVVVEASGNPSGWKLALEKTKPRGTLVLKSTYHGGLDFNPAPLVIDEITVVGSRCGLFGPALRIMERGLADPSQLISRILPMERGEEAFQLARERGNLKIVVRM
ncbi:alcohol dehydrogenase catalytic domain-containing protein [Thermodesulfobacteriota bacterium]